MKKLTILNDWHIGAIRSAGTTPGSAEQLRHFLLSQFKATVEKVKTDLVILGDLFDSEQIPLTDLAETYTVLKNWLYKGQNLFLVDGNHDLSKTSSKLSSFQFLCKLLGTGQHGDKVTHVQGGGMLIAEGYYVIPHMSNQDCFDLELAKVPKVKYLLLHVNYNNNFAKESDHSLNLSEEQAKALPVEKIVFAHEHYARTALKGKVFVCGNQVPSSVSDCLDGRDKTLTILPASGEVETEVTWKSLGFRELNWKNVEETGAEFVRFVGEAKPEEVAEMVSVIARFRKNSKAFVVSNAVKVLGSDGLVLQEAASLEEARAFDIMGALKKVLTEEQVKIIESLRIGK
jgi:UDP-2,3-diacylglucosamine pyrophosphatase LpxH